MRILVSACLLGACCRYDGQCKGNDRVLALNERHTLIPVCPEQLGGLPTPRLPAEIRDGLVMRKDGADITAAYRKGAEETLRLCRMLKCDLAILKSKSPSCGAGQVYDGSFSAQLVPGYGVTARLLKEAGVPVLTEQEISALPAYSHPFEGRSHIDP